MSPITTEEQKPVLKEIDVCGVMMPIKEVAEFMKQINSTDTIKLMSEKKIPYDEAEMMQVLEIRNSKQ